jgi:signal transduction histidine kinase
MSSFLKESRRLNNLVEELLQTTRETRINRKRINMISVVDESLQIINTLFAEKGVSLHKRYHNDAVWLSADFEKLEQVIINIVKNALEASKAGGSVCVDIAAADKWVSVIVADNGEGIPGKDMDTIFDVFYTTKKNGTGLGLSISRNIVEAHGGNLTAVNNPDGGAKFIMQLPIEEGRA